MNYYEILGVSKQATEDEIKKAYRKLASQHHPDKGGDKVKFQEIQSAYATLSDEQKRQQYDNPRPQFGGGNPGGFEFHFDGPGGFEQFFGGGHPFGDIFGFRQQRRQATNRNVQLQTSISLEDAFWGKELIANVTLPSGKEQTVNIKIPQGIHEGTTLRLSGMGDDSVKELPRGDILLNVHIGNHPRFIRQGDDLFQEVTINSIEAMLGTTITLTSIDDKQLETTIPAGIQNDAMIGLAGYGMHNFNDPSRRGRLIVKVKIVTPALSEEQKNNLRNLNII
jgi:DnaJ-class molecular chaperone